MKRLLIFLTALLLFACAQPRRTEIPQFPSSKVIKLHNVEARSIKLSEIFNDIQYIPLETGNNSLGDVRKVRKMKDQYFIQCNNGVFVFSKDGGYIATIGSKGEGNGKYKVLTDFLIDTLANTIEILDRRSQKILYHNMEGVFLGEWTFDLNVESFFKYDRNTYLFYCSNLINVKNEQRPYRFLSVRKDRKEIIGQAMEINEHQSNFISYADIDNFIHFHHTTIFTMSASDTIYDVNVSGIIPRYFFDFGKQRIPRDFFEKDFKDVSYFDRALEKTNYVGLFNNFLLENDKLIATIARCGKENLFIVHSKKTGQNLVADKLVDDMGLVNKGKPVRLALHPKGAFDDEIYSLVEPTVIIDAMDSLRSSMTNKEWAKFLTNNPELLRLDKGLTIVDNPILQVSKLKSF